MFARKWLKGLDVEMQMGGATFFISLQFNYIDRICVGKVKLPLLCFNSSVSHARFLSNAYQKQKVQGQKHSKEHGALEIKKGNRT